MTGQVRYTVVVPTAGRATLRTLLSALDGSFGPPPEEIIVVDDSRGGVSGAVSTMDIPRTSAPLRILRSGGRGPASARNLGWRAADADWVVFLDDDVIPGPDWAHALQRDLLAANDNAAASQATITVPLADDRAPTDLERNTAALSTAWWITADMAYRRDVLAEVGGFDESFPRAYREDADLAMRVRLRGYRLERGRRTTTHPVRPAGFFASVRAQAGNADNAIMRRKYGHRWRQRIGEGPGRTRHHLGTTAAGAAALLLATASRRRPVVWPAAATSAGVWLALTADFAVRRIAPGPRTVREIVCMAITSAAIPPVACWHRLCGELRATSHAPLPPPEEGPPPREEEAG